MDELTYHNEPADLHFSWDGWMQVMVTPGRNAPPAFPDRFDIREADLRRDDMKDLFPQYPDDPSVHFVPYTQEAFEALCDAWWRGEELCVGVRDYVKYPWTTRSWGHLKGELEYRYDGGKHITVKRAEADNAWRPLIDVLAEGRSAKTISTSWLSCRTDAWEDAWLKAHGIKDTGRGLNDAIVEWTIKNFPWQVDADCIAGAFTSWIRRTIPAEFQGRKLERFRNLGVTTRYVSEWRPWSTTRQDVDGTRWVFWWCGHPYAYVYSPDFRLSNADCRLVLRPEELAGKTPVVEWLESHADKWIKSKVKASR
ncbi:hypothetical protein ACFQ61_08050 [Streptomyces sp. NPDC056500]|uniref:hypothetical protein n=1 Tax=Streptomyces sp. NPDC056500 TaxID=3345840 RepID=UPI003689BECE